MLCSFLTGPGVIAVLPAFVIRYMTLRYKFEETGVRMMTGMFFRNEVIVAFRRIQDIHVSANVLQRWFGIATVSIQTASGNSAPEIVLEGMTNANQLRDWLYERLRGAKGMASLSATHAANNPRTDSIDSDSGDQALLLLREIRDALSVVAARKQQ